MKPNKKHLFLTFPLLVSAVSLGAMTRSLAAVYDAKTDWSVQSDAGADYCSASQGFTDKAYVTFAQRNDQSLSLAVDFQKKTFEAGKSYKFKVKSGNSSRSFTLEPSSGNAVVFPLGADKSFMQELSNTKILSLGVNGEEYNFSLRDVDGLVGGLGTCVAKLDGVNVVEKKALPKEKKAPKRSEADKLRAENIRLSNLLKEQRRLSDAKLSSVTSHAPSEEARERVYVLEKENETLKEKLSSLSKLESDLKTVETLKTEIELIQSEKKTLKEGLAKANSQILTLESEKVSADSSKVDASILDALKIDLSTQKELISSLQNEKITLATELSSAKQALSGVQSKVSLNSQKETQQVITLQTQLEEANQRLADLKSALELSKTEVSRLESLQNSESTDLASLQADRDGLMQKLAEKEEALLEKSNKIDALQTQLMTAKEQAVEKQGGAADVASLEQIIGDLKSDIGAKDTEIASLKAEVLEANRKEDPVDSDQQDVVASLEARSLEKDVLISSLEKEKADLLEKLSDQMAQVKIAQKSLEKDSALENEEYKFLDRRYKTTLMDLEAIKSENISLEDQIELLEKEIVSLKSSESKIALASNASWDLEKATRRYQEAQREITGLGRLIEQKDQQCDLEKQDIEKLLFDPEIADNEQRATLARLEQDIKEKNRIITTLEQQIKARPSDVVAVVPQVSDNKVSIGTPKVQPLAVEKAEAVSSKLDVLSYAQALVQKAGLSDIQEQDRAGMKILRWKKEGLHGTAVEQPLIGRSLSSAVNAYLDRAQSKCSGDFAAVPSMQTPAKQTYEIACVKPTGNGSSASLLFIKDRDTMVTVAHEGRTEMMEQAIEARDSISKIAKN